MCRRQAVHKEMEKIVPLVRLGGRQVIWSIIAFLWVMQTCMTMCSLQMACYFQTNTIHRAGQEQKLPYRMMHDSMV